MSPNFYTSLSEKRPVAIVGIAAQLPSGTHAQHDLDYKQFVEFLLNKGEAYEELPRERSNSTCWSEDASSRNTSPHGSFLKDTGSFDHVEFGISNEEARNMALSTKKLLELSFLSLIDAGINYRGQNVGWYASGTAHDVLSVAELDDQEGKSAFASIPCLADEISRHLDLRGPCVPIDATCNSSLTALHLAVQAIRAGECDAAVVAGCHLVRFSNFAQQLSDSASARECASRLFDAADGLAIGEGAIAVVLKPYDAAIRDGDHIYGNILGTGINASGAVTPVSHPGSDMRVDAMHRAYLGIDSEPNDVDYIEIHGVGAFADDSWISQNFGRDREVLIGSVAGNMGHLGNVSFLVSLCKACSMFETGVIPPSVNFPNGAWDKCNLRVPLEPTHIKARSPSGKVTISISSSGVGGTNGHVVMQGILPQGVDQMDVQEAVHSTLLVAGGLTPRSASAVAANLDCLSDAFADQLAALSTICGRRVRQMTWRSYAVTHPGQKIPRFSSPVFVPHVRQPMVFVFPGQGPQHINMGRQLFHRYTVFRDTILELDACYRDATGMSLIQQVGLFDDVHPLQVLPAIWPSSIIFPAMAMIQIALYDLLRSLGLRADVFVGHSAGETPMLYASGAGPKRMAMEIAIAQGQALSAVEKAGGAMAALSCDAAQARSIIHLVRPTGERGILDIASYNASGAVAISGHEYLVDRAVEIAASRGISARKLATRVAVHSGLMDLCQAEYFSRIKEIFARYPGEHKPQVTTYSTATGALLEGFTANYFWHNFRDPVHFAQAFEAICQTCPHASFVEVSPHPVLSTYMQEMGAQPSSVVCPMSRSKKYEDFQEERQFLSCLGKIVAMGYNSVDFHILNGQDTISHSIELPPYPFGKRQLGSPPPSPPPDSPRDALRATVLHSLDIDPSSFSDDAPLSSYGLDSLAAGRLAFALRPFVTLASADLLEKVSLLDLERRLEEKQTGSEATEKVAPSITYFQWDEVHKSGQTVLKLVDNGETPLIVLHGASGSALPFISIQEKFTTSLWALQTTPETPKYPFTAFCRFYYEQIKAAQPQGPYRLGAFCASTLMTSVIAKMLEDNGDEVVQLCYIDHFPLLWLSPLIQPDDEAMQLRKAGPSLIQRLLDSMLALYRADPSPARHRAAQDWENAANGLEAPAHVLDWWETFNNLHVGIYEFFFELLPPEQAPTLSALQEALCQWMASIKAPKTIYVAQKGYLAFIPETGKAGWEQYGIERVAPDAKIITVTGGHFNVLDDAAFIQTVQTEWSRR
ncbi:uncharacterized protein LAESUDRAFT_548010 [Laetiporus sulphureus 93-53]|uniref:Ketosynthase family 3 (KS3) domain-containing protein n=1 Tax=Laetiporus sulphureus 93-53 TaxID=1314785 RepID=A0A165FQC3_9APHY|nr:uncharacterized protein LAESUDRAFT_548010 [Laetiporus sulphureus 93-53]KZT09317.1 hypothetical protein LAESUDRAFT_548010 [Laetiporus sulphureus 93-53]